MSDDWCHLETNEHILYSKIINLEKIIESLKEDSIKDKEKINELNKRLTQIEQKINRKTTL